MKSVEWHMALDIEYPLEEGEKAKPSIEKG